MAPPPLINDLSGHQFGLFTVEGYSHAVEKPTPAQNEHFWYCRCACGKTFKRSSANIRRSKSCGCLRTKAGIKLMQRLGDGCTYGPRKRLADRDFTGLKQGSLTVMGRQDEGEWLCECECGKSCTRTARQLQRGARSCGCRRVHKQPGEASFAELYRRARQSAERRELEFSLTKEEFKEITSRPCVYCHAPPAPTPSHDRRYNGAYSANKIDLLTPELGFVERNVVPCCPTCRRARDGQPLSEFKAWIARLLDRFRPPEAETH